MQNYYHLLIQTPEANISRSMRHIISDLRISIRGQLNEPKNVAMYLRKGDIL
jgi:hypothetical protein